MKKRILFLVVFGLFHIANAQNYQTVEDIDSTCSQLSFSGNEDAEIAVDNILDKIGLSRNFVLVECPDINNALAKNIETADGRTERYILYDGNFFTQIDIKASNNWAATSVLAHEIGHHLNGHSLNDEGSNHKFEIEADEFSGFVLARMGANLADAKSALSTLRYEKATRTHPAKLDRLAAIEKGWNRGAGQLKIIKENTGKFENPTSASQVASNYINAIMGDRNIETIKTTSSLYKGTLQGIDLDLTFMQKFPNKTYVSIETAGNIMNKQVYNGQIGYTVAMGGVKTELFGKDLETLKNSSAFFGLDLGTTAEFIGIEVFNNTEVYVLKKDFSTYYFDKKTSLKLAEKNGFEQESGAINYQTITYKDYQNVKGILYPQKILVDAGGVKINFELSEFLINEDVTDSDFE